MNTYVVNQILSQSNIQYWKIKVGKIFSICIPLNELEGYILKNTMGVGRWSAAEKMKN